MQYLLLIFENEQRWAASGYSAAEMAEYTAFGAEHRPSIKGGNALLPTKTAKTVRVRDGKTVTTDGPFAETKEQLSGYYLVEADSAEAAAKIGAKIPAARYGSIEVRPIMTFN